MTITHADGTQEAVSADKIILATGSVNAVPPIPGLKETPTASIPPARFLWKSCRRAWWSSAAV